jgi:hypothetical protein
MVAFNFAQKITTMAKAIAKPATPKPVAKKPVAKRTTTAKADLEKVSIEILEKLKSLGLEPTLQAEIEWCLGSYSFDKNPVGLIEAAQKALVVFEVALAKKTKGVTAKFIADIEKVAKG